MSDAVHRVLTGRFSNPGKLGAVPASTNPAVVLERAKDTVRQAASAMGMDMSERLDSKGARAATATAKGESYFDPEKLSELKNLVQKPRRQENLIYMSPDEFLSLAKPLSEPFAERAERVAGLLERGEKFNSVPFLRLDESGQIFNHDGRHRAMALKKLGVEKMPVYLHSDDIRWNEQVLGKGDAFYYVENLPKQLIGEDGKTKIKSPFHTEGPNRGKPLPEYSADVAKPPAADAATDASVLGGSEFQIVKKSIDDINKILPEIIKVSDENRADISRYEKFRGGFMSHSANLSDRKFSDKELEVLRDPFTSDAVRELSKTNPNIFGDLLNELRRAAESEREQLGEAGPVADYLDAALASHDWSKGGNPEGNIVGELSALLDELKKYNPENFDESRKALDEATKELNDAKSELSVAEDALEQLRRTAPKYVSRSDPKHNEYAAAFTEWNSTNRPRIKSLKKEIERITGDRYSEYLRSGGSSADLDRLKRNLDNAQNRFEALQYGPLENDTVRFLLDKLKDNLRGINSPNLSKETRKNVRRIVENIEAEEAKQAARLWQEIGIESPYFKRFFAGSVVLDEQGRPLVMFHGSPFSGIESFETFGTAYGLMGTGAYFTDNPLVAFSYATSKRGLRKAKKEGVDPDPSITPVYLSLKNPIDMDDPADSQQWLTALKKNNVAGRMSGDELAEYVGVPASGATNKDWLRGLESVLQQEEIYEYEAAEIVRDVLKSMGHDGLTHIETKGMGITDKVRSHRVYVAFEPAQIKSAIRDETASTTYPDLRTLDTDVKVSPLKASAKENAGTFDLTDPSILKGIGIGAAVPVAAALSQGQEDEEEGNPEEELPPMTLSSREYVPMDTVMIYDDTVEETKAELDRRSKIKQEEDGLVYKMMMLEADYFELDDDDPRKDQINSQYELVVDKFKEVHSDLGTDEFSRFLKGVDYFYETQPGGLLDYDVDRAFEVMSFNGVDMLTDINLRKTQESMQQKRFERMTERGGTLVNLSGQNMSINKLLFKKANTFNHPVQSVQVTESDKMILQRDLNNLEDLKEDGLISYLLYRELKGDVMLF